MMNALALADLESWSNVGRNAVQILALLVGGGWAWLKFVRGRTFRRRGELTVEGALHAFAGESALVVRVAFKNTGLARISVVASPTVIVSRVFTSGWEDGQVQWLPPEPDSSAPGKKDPDDESVTKALAEASLVMLETTEVVEPARPSPTTHSSQPNNSKVGITIANRSRAALMTKHGSRRKTLVWTAYAVVAGAPLRELGQQPSTSPVPGKKEG